MVSDMGCEIQFQFSISSVVHKNFRCWTKASQQNTIADYVYENGLAIAPLQIINKKNMCY